jgi:hypothetical protein
LPRIVVVATCRFRRQDLGDVPCAHVELPAGKSSSDLREAGAVDGGYDIRASLEDRVDLVVEDRARGLGVLQGKRAAEAAALVRVGEIDQVDVPHRPKQAQRPLAEPEHAERVTGRVVRHASLERRSDVDDARRPHEELRQLEHARRQSFDLSSQILVLHLLREIGIELTNHRDAGRRRRHDQLRRAEYPDEAAGERDSLLLIAGVEVELAATGLRGWKLDLVPQPLEHSHRGDTGFRKHRVVEAGDEEGDAHGRRS